MKTFKEHLQESIHPELKAMGATEDHVKKFLKFKDCDEKCEQYDVEHIPPSAKRARTSALRDLHDNVPAQIIHKMNIIHGYSGKESLKV